VSFEAVNRVSVPYFYYRVFVKLSSGSATVLFKIGEGGGLMKCCLYVSVCFGFITSLIFTKFVLEATPVSCFLISYNLL